jgi:hypothetical protein
MKVRLSKEGGLFQFMGRVQYRPGRRGLGRVYSDAQNSQQP